MDGPLVQALCCRLDLASRRLTRVTGNHVTQRIRKNTLNYQLSVPFNVFTKAVKMC